jgi:hypothetical protein
MNRHLQLAAAFLLTTTLAYARPPAAQTGKQGKQPRRLHEDVEWLWQYTPADRDTDGRENELVQNDRFIPMLQDNFTAPQSFFGVQGTKFKPLPDTILDFLTVPNKVLQDEHRYVSISGCVIHFCPSRGLLWVDLNPAAKNSSGDPVDPGQQSNDAAGRRIHAVGLPEPGADGAWCGWTTKRAGTDSCGVQEVDRALVARADCGDEDCAEDHPRGAGRS